MLHLLGIAALLLLPQAQAPPSTPNAAAAAAPPASDDLVTLHAYANLVQIPVLVLTDRHGRIPPLSPDQFSMNIDSGPYFRPRHIRQEGSDSIRMVVLLDSTANMAALLSTFGPAMHDLATVLTPADVLSVSIIRGSTLTHTQGAPFSPVWGDHLATFVRQELAPPNPPATPPAGVPSLLWNALLQTFGRFGDATGRRVLLLVTDGETPDNNHDLQQLRDVATTLGITVFALRQRPASDTRKEDYVLSRDSFAYARREKEGGDTLLHLTELTGGTTLEIRGHPLAEGMMRVVRLVRERYILDFVRPTKLEAGAHSFDIRLKGKGFFVRSGGIGVPLPDPAIANDPNTVPSDPTLEPPVGKRRVLNR